MNETEFWWSCYAPRILSQGRYEPVLEMLISSASLLGSLGWSCLLLWTTVVTSTLLFIYYFLLLPMNLKRDLSDVGYGYLTDEHRHRQWGARKKVDLVKEVQRLRKIGQVPPAFPNGWFPLLESEDVKKKQVKEVAALGEHFAVFRNDQGKVHVLDAYCPHLGANMAVGGTVHGNCLECPFHRWRFDGSSGRCVAVPYAEKVPEFVRVKRWPVIEVNSLIFVWYHAENENPSWYPRDLDPIKNQDWMFHGRSEFLIACHIQDISENGGDIAHLNAIHAPNLFTGHDLRFFDKFPWTFLRHIWTGDWEPDPAESHIGHMTLALDTRLFDKLSLGKMDVKVEQVGPAYAELQITGSWGPMILLQAVTPVEPHVQRVVNRIYAPFRHCLIARLMLYGELVMFERDIMVWNHKKYLSKPQLVKEEKALAKHRRWYSQFYTKNSPSLTFRKETVDW